MNISLPNPLTPDNIKKDFKFGAKVMNSILESTKAYRDKRNKVFKENRMFAEGKQPTERYRDMMQIDGNNPMLSIYLSALPIASKFENIVVEGYYMRRERAKVTSLSKDVQDRKDKERAEAKYRMNYSNQISAIAEQAGIQLEDPDAFTPKTLDDLDIHFYLNDRQLEETLMQKAVTFCLNDNEVNEVKKACLSDLFRYNLLALYEYADKNGRPIIKRLNPWDTFYDFSDKPDFSDIKFAGYFERMTIGEIRANFKVSVENERELWKVARTYGFRSSWNTEWYHVDNRPYDGYAIEVVNFWWLANKVINYVEGKNRYGKDIFIFQDDVKKNSNRRTYGQIYPLTSYKGVGIKGTDIILEWGEEPNMVREGEDKEKVLCPYSFYMPNNSGDMLVPSSVFKMKDFIVDMDLAVNKLRNILSLIPPDAPTFDISGLSNMLGGGDESNGDDFMAGLQLVKMYYQTGAVVWNSSDQEGNNTGQPPIMPTSSPALTKVNAFITTYNFALGNIRDMLGINEFRDGSSIPSRTGFRVMQSALDSSNTATYPIYSGTIVSLQKVMKRVGIRIWDNLFFSKNPNKGIVGVLGKNNIDILKNREDITSSSYDFVFELDMEDAQRQELEGRITAALTAGTIDLADVELIRDVYDYRIAAKMLRVAMLNKQERDAAAQSRLIREQNEGLAATAQASEQAKQATIQMQSQADMQIEQFKRDSGRDERYERAAYDALIKGLEAGAIPYDQVAPFIQQVFQNRGINIDIETQQKVQGIQQQAAEAQYISETA